MLRCGLSLYKWVKRWMSWRGKEGVRMWVKGLNVWMKLGGWWWGWDSVGGEIGRWCFLVGGLGLFCCIGDGLVVWNGKKLRILIWVVLLD